MYQEELLVMTYTTFSLRPVLKLDMHLLKMSTDIDKRAWVSITINFVVGFSVLKLIHCRGYIFVPVF